MQFLKLGKNVIVNLEQVVMVNYIASENRALLLLTGNKSVDVYTPEDYQKLMDMIDPVNVASDTQAIEPLDPPDDWVEPDPKVYDCPAELV